jgi:large subunit ribosomal protein L24
MARHVRSGDLVMVTSGSHKGKTGTIMRVIAGEEPGSERVVIKGLNLRTKHLKPTRLSPQGGIVTREAPIHISNVSPVVDGKPTRVRFVTKTDGTKVRVAARNGQELGVVRSADAKKSTAKKK